MRPRPERVRLGDLLLGQALITEAQLAQALAEGKAGGKRLGRVLTDHGWVTEVQIAKALARQLRAPFVDLGTVRPRADMLALLAEPHARRLRALPLEPAEGGGVRVAMVDPTDAVAYDELSRLIGSEPDIAVVAETQFADALDRLYRGGDEIAGLARELGSEIGAGAGASGDDDFGRLLGLGQASAEDAPVVRLLASVFEQALRQRASDIHIEPQEKSLRIRFRIDGVLHVQTDADAKIAGAVALRLKLMSGLDISEKRLPQDGRFNVRLRRGSVDVRLSTLPTQHGESVVLRLLNQDAAMLSLERLELPAPLAETLGRALAQPNGLVLVTGPTGSGKTTTLYATLAALNGADRKIITVEDPVEYRLPGLNQVQVLDKIDLSFARVLRAALRQDPDVVLVGEMRDRDTAEIGLRAAMTGHLVLSTLHTNDALSTPMRLIDMGVPAYMVGNSLRLVIAQRLVRCVCEHCAEPARADARGRAWVARLVGGDAAAARLLGDDGDGPGRLRVGRGCAECNRVGLRGRRGVYEFVEMTPELVQALGDERDPLAFAAAGRRQMAGRTLARDALRLALAGRTTLDEAMRLGAGDA